MRKTLIYIIYLGLIFSNSHVLAQKNLQGVINEYAKVTNVSSNVVTVDNITFFHEHDTVLLIQMTGVSRDGNQVNKAGKYEFHIVRSVNSQNKTITLVASAEYDATTELVQIVRVPSYKNARVSQPLNCLPWDGEKGGVLVLMVNETLTLNGDIDVSAQGFWGGGQSGSFSGNCNPTYTNGDYQANESNMAGYKGQGAVSNTVLSQKLRGIEEAWNGGGGGNGKFSGGAGGGNAGGGGRGGYQACGIGPTSIGGVKNRYSEWANRVFMGGGGGSGTGDNTTGGKGGGIVIISARDIQSNGGAAIKANGQSVGGAPSNGGAGGGGAGGSILLSVEKHKDFKAEIKGGNGGNTTRGTCNDENTGSIGTGGGGGGGLLHVAGNSESITVDNLAGYRGVIETTTGTCTPYALNGEGGTVNENLALQLRGFVYNFITTNDTTVCFGETKIVKASQPQGGNGTFAYLWEQKIRSKGIWQPASGVNTTMNYITPALTDTVFYRRTVRTIDNGQLLEDQSLTVKIVVVPEIVNQLDFRSDSTQCENVLSMTIKGKTASGGGTGSITYQWEESVNNADWSAITGANSKDISVSFQSGERYYRRKATSQGCIVASDATHIIALPAISGNSIQGDQELCENETADQLAGQSASGGNGVFGYNWQISDDNEVWTTLEANSENYQPDQKYIGERFYRRIVASGQRDCCRDTSQTVVVRYDQEPSPASVGSSQFLDFQFSTTVNALPATVGKGEWSVVEGNFNITQPDQPSTEITNLGIGINTIQWTVSNGVCPAVSGQITIEIRDITVPEGFSPNGDNVNDCFKVLGAENAVSSELIIFNRYNKIVYESSSFKGNEQDCAGWWDGRNSSGKELPSGTYFYQLTLNGDKVYKGYVILKR